MQHKHKRTTRWSHRKVGRVATRLTAMRRVAAVEVLRLLALMRLLRTNAPTVARAVRDLAIATPRRSWSTLNRAGVSLTQALGHARVALRRARTSAGRARSVLVQARRDGTLRRTLADAARRVPGLVADGARTYAARLRTYAVETPRRAATVGLAVAGLVVALFLGSTSALVSSAGEAADHVSAGAGASDREAAAQRAGRAARAETPAAIPTSAPAPAKKPAPPWVNPMPNVPLSSCFGLRWGAPHQGIDFAGDDGTPIVAVGAGTVVAAGWIYSGYGQSVMIDHGNGYFSHYAHASKLLVSEGQRVKTGQSIALEGATGDSIGPHLHFEIHQGLWNQVDPAPWLRARGVQVGC